MVLYRPLFRIQILELIAAALKIMRLLMMEESILVTVTSMSTLLIQLLLATRQNMGPVLTSLSSMLVFRYTLHGLTLTKHLRLGVDFTSYPMI